MTTLFDSQRFSTRIKMKRGNRGLRAIAEETGVSASTLSRLEQGETPEMKIFIAICDWLRTEPDEFMIVPWRRVEPGDPMDRIEFILRTDTSIAPANINAVMVLLRSLYEKRGGAQ